MRVIALLLLSLQLLVRAGGNTATAANSVDYSCTHAGSWLMNNGDYSTIFGALTDMLTSEKTTDTGWQVDTYSSTANCWAVTTNRIPRYGHTFSQSEVSALNSRPKKATDFKKNSQTTAEVGTYYDFGANIGYKTTSCIRGWWPPGPTCPTAQNARFTFPLLPMPETTVVANATARPGINATSLPGCYTGMGAIGLWVSGAKIYGMSDGKGFNYAQTYTSASNNLAASASTWHNLAPIFESNDMDVCSGHAANGDYHSHNYPPCLALRLGDTGTGHSPIYGWAFDGFPVYGPFQSAGTLALSCWAKRDYTTAAADNLGGCGTGVKLSGGSAQHRTCLLNNIYNVSAGVTAIDDSTHWGPKTTDLVVTQSGNTITAASGAFLEDYYYNLTCGKGGGRRLDSYNGHDHDGLGYHYHVTTDSPSTMQPVFPFVVGPKFYGCIVGGKCNTLPIGAASWLERGPANGWSGGLKTGSNTLLSSCTPRSGVFEYSLSQGKRTAACDLSYTPSPTALPTAPTPKPSIKGVPTARPTLSPTALPTLAPTQIKVSSAKLSLSLSGISGIDVYARTRARNLGLGLGLGGGVGLDGDEGVGSDQSLFGRLLGLGRQRRRELQTTTMSATAFRNALADFLGVEQAMIANPVVESAVMLARRERDRRTLLGALEWLTEGLLAGAGDSAYGHGYDEGLTEFRALEAAGQGQERRQEQAQGRRQLAGITLTVVISGTSATVYLPDIANAMSNVTALASALSTATGVPISVTYLGISDVTPTMQPTLAPTSATQNSLFYTTIGALLAGVVFFAVALLTWCVCCKDRGIKKFPSVHEDRDERHDYDFSAPSTPLPNALVPYAAAGEAVEPRSDNSESQVSDVYILDSRQLGLEMKKVTLIGDAYTGLIRGVAGSAGSVVDRVSGTAGYVGGLVSAPFTGGGGSAPGRGPGPGPGPGRGPVARPGQGQGQGQGGGPRVQAL